jgi:hypothetical protein
MYSTSLPHRLCKGCGENVVNGYGLGQEPDVKAITKEYGGGKETGGQAAMAVKMAVTVALMFVPVVGWIAAAAINLPVIGGVADKILKPITGPIAKMFKKATHMESCMKWWTDSNIRSMMAGISPYPITEDVKREYQLQHARPLVYNEGGRWNNMASIFVSKIRANPDIMQFQCATMPQGRAETKMTEADAVTAQQYLAQLKEAARQEEYFNIAGNAGSVVEQKSVAVQQTREAGLVTGSKAFQLPEGVTSISKGGALVLGPGKSTNLILDYGLVGKSTITRK